MNVKIVKLPQTKEIKLKIYSAAEIKTEEGIYKLLDARHNNTRFITIKRPLLGGFVTLYLSLDSGILEPMADWTTHSFIKTNETLSIGISDEK